MIGPPISYMKECGVFQPLPSTMNPLGLCHFYPTDPSSLSTLMPPKAPTTVDHLNNLLVLAKSSTGCTSLLCLKVAPSRHWGYYRNCIHAMCLHIFQSSCLKKRRMGTNHGYRVAHSVPTPVQNDLAFLNHIINAHYHANFTCGTCLSTVTTLGQQMKRHISECPGLPALPEKSSQESVHGESSPKKKHAHGSSGSKSKDGGSKGKQKHQIREVTNRVSQHPRKILKPAIGI